LIKPTMTFNQYLLISGTKKPVLRLALNGLYVFNGQRTKNALT